MNYYFDVLKKYAVFEGRARRKEYWMFVLFNFLVSFALGIVSFIIGDNIGVIGMLYCVAVFIPSLAVAVRRLHDTNHSGWWLLINLIPFIGLIIFLVFAFTDSQAGENQYGSNPKEVNIGQS